MSLVERQMKILYLKRFEVLKVWQKVSLSLAVLPTAMLWLCEVTAGAPWMAPVDSYTVSSPGTLISCPLGTPKHDRIWRHVPRSERKKNILSLFSLAYFIKMPLVLLVHWPVSVLLSGQIKGWLFGDIKVNTEELASFRNVPLLAASHRSLKSTSMKCA